VLRWGRFVLVTPERLGRARAACHGAGSPSTMRLAGRSGLRRQSP
jgi:hypothetical protein